MLGCLHDTASKRIVDKVDSFYKNTSSQNSCRRSVCIITGDQVKKMQDPILFGTFLLGSRLHLGVLKEKFMEEVKEVK